MLKIMPIEITHLIFALVQSHHLNNDYEKIQLSWLYGKDKHSTLNTQHLTLNT